MPRCRNIAERLQPFLHLLNTTSNGDLAALVGCNRNTVGKERRRLGYSPVSRGPDVNPRTARHVSWMNALVASPPDSCVEFPGSRTRLGYGSMKYQGRTRGAHQVAYEIANGPIPAGLDVLHGKGGRRCISRACCNPTHLYVGTHQQNMDDMVRDGTQRSPPRRPGRLSDEQCSEIRASTFRGVDLARQFGVSQQTICDIRHGRRGAK